MLDCVFLVEYWGGGNHVGCTFAQQASQLLGNYSMVMYKIECALAIWPQREHFVSGMVVCQSIVE